MESLSRNSVMFICIFVCLFSCSAHKSISPDVAYKVNMVENNYRHSVILPSVKHTQITSVVRQDTVKPFKAFEERLSRLALIDTAKQRREAIDSMRAELWAFKVESILKIDSVRAIANLASVDANRAKVEAEVANGAIDGLFKIYDIIGWGSLFLTVCAFIFNIRVKPRLSFLLN